MRAHTPPPFDAPLDAHEQRACALLDALHAGDDDAAWCLRWMHPRFRDRDVAEVRAAAVTLDDTRLVVARDQGFDGWAELAAFTQAVAADGAIRRFELAVEAVVAGDVTALRAMLRAHPELARARAPRAHGATLLHYVAANGVEGWRQRTPASVLEVAAALLEAGAEPDALADMYDARCTTMSMLVSSSPPHDAGMQGALAELLLDHGAALEGAGTAWQSTLLTALAFGFVDTARALVRRGAPVRQLAAAAGLGDLPTTARLLPDASAKDRHAALALAAQLGHADVVRLLLDAGEDPDRYNPEGLHAHATPLHHAALGGHVAAVQVLAERGARLDLRDTIYHGTPLGWALHGGREDVAAFLRARGAAE